MRVLRPGIDLEMAHDAPSQRSARHHPLHRLHDDALGILAFEDRALAAFLEAARVAGIPAKEAVLPFVAGERYLLGIDDDDVVAAIHVRGVGRFVLAAQPIGDERGKAPQHQPFGVDQQPLLVQLGRLGGIGLHWAMSLKAAQYAHYEALVKPLNACLFGSFMMRYYNTRAAE